MTRSVLQLRKGTTAQHSSFIGQLAELSVDTTKKTVVVHDGVTAGGNALAPLNSPAFTGTPTSTTPTVGDSSGKIATTQFVAQTVAAIGSGPANTDFLAEGTTNRYFTQARARQSVSASGNLSYDINTGIFSYTQPTNVSVFLNDAGYLTSSNVRNLISVTGSLTYNTATGVISYTQAVDSVNGQTGVVVLTTNNVAESGGVLYFTNARARTAISVSGPDVTYSTSTGVMTFTSATNITNGTNDSIALGVNLVNFTINNALKARLDATKFAIDLITGRDVNAGADGEDFTLRGGTGGSTSGSGGDVTVSGGLVTDGNGGNVILAASSGVGSLRDGGNIVITSGDSGTGGLKGNITLSSFAKTSIFQRNVTTGTSYGSIVIGSQLDLPASPAGGAIHIYSSKAANTGSAGGGLIEVKASAGVTGGNVSVTAGAGTAGIGGSVQLTGGAAAGASFTGGDVVLTPGVGTSGATTGTVILAGNTTVSANKIITQSTAPTQDFHLTNRRFVNKQALAFSIALG